MLKIEKRARLDVRELVLVTSENLQEVAEWCGGFVDGDIIRFIDNTSGSPIEMVAFASDYIETSINGFACWSGGFISDNYNRNEQGELI